MKILNRINSKKKVEAEEEMSNKRPLTGFLHVVRIILIVIGISAAIYQIFGLRIMDYIFWPRQYYSLLIACFLPLVYLTVPHRKGVMKVPWFDIVASILVIICCAYIYFNTITIEYTAWEYLAPLEGIIIAFAFCFLIFEPVRRSGGWMFFAVCFFFFTFPTFTNHLPGILWGIGFTPAEAVAYFVYGIDSIFGLVMNVMGNILIGFLIFAVVLNKTGGGEFFLNLAFAMVGGTRGGPAKVAVVASGFMGSMSGSPMSNVVTTGAITIPAMKRLGYSSSYAGAIEACASTGGVLMPPVMGTTAFIIAQILGLSYAQVAISAFIPSILYYVSLLLQVDSMSVHLGMKGLPKEEIPSLLKTLKDGWPYLISIIYLVFMLFYLRRVNMAPYYAAGLLIITSLVWKWRSYNKEQWVQLLVSIGETVCLIMPALLGVGFVIGSMITTGVASAFSREIILLAGGNATLLLVFGAFVSFVLGMGMTITACYIFLAMTMAPPLIALGFNQLAVHLFVMYYSMLSFITPPVALAAYTAATLAKTSQLKTALTAMRLGFVLYLVPFAFVYNPSLILQGNLTDTLVSVVLFIVGCIFVVGCTEGEILFFKKLEIWQRFLALVPGLFLMTPNIYLRMIGIGVGFIMVLMLFIRYRKQNMLTVDII